MKHGMLELQGWTDGMDSDPALTLFIGVMTLIIGYWHVMASVEAYAIKIIMQIVYTMGMRPLLVDRTFLEMQCTV